MFRPEKNAYLQLVCAINPRVINKAVDQALRNKDIHPKTDSSLQRMEFMQPCLYAPWVDVTRARLGFGRVGLRLANRDLHSTDHLVQLQAIHSVLDLVQVSESAMFLINLQVVYRVIDLIHHENPVVREKICYILTHLATYHQGRKRILSRPTIIRSLMKLTMDDRKEIRYAAAYTLNTLSRDRCALEIMRKVENIIEDLLKKIMNEHTETVLLHLKTLSRLIEWQAESALKSNAFQIMFALLAKPNVYVVCAAMDCMAQLLKHSVGMVLADTHDLTFYLIPFLYEQIEVIIATAALMEVTTLTTNSKWRAKERCTEITRRLVNLCHTPNKPVLQLSCMQVLINLCDCPDIRKHVKDHWLEKVKQIRIRTHEQWDGTTEVAQPGLNTGHLYRTEFKENVETIKNEPDQDYVVNVHSYIRTLHARKNQLIDAINWKSYKN